MSRSSESARLDAARLLECALERDGAWLLAHPEYALTPGERARYDAALARRAEGEPVAYVTGSAGFYGRSFAVGPEVLVPRPETEHVVMFALEYLRALSAERAPRVCDVGTGSGILAVTIALEIPGAEVVALDVSPAALAVARQNAARHCVDARIRFVPSDLFDALDPGRRFDCIVANLPYVATRELRDAPDPTAFEPRLALDGGPDGVRLYERLLRDVPRRLVPGALLLMEAGPGSAAHLAALAAKAFHGEAVVDVDADYAGLLRIVRVRLPDANF